MLLRFNEVFRVLLFISLLWMMAACSSENVEDNNIDRENVNEEVSTNTEMESESEPITLVLNNSGGAPEDFLEDTLIQPTQDKFPHITIEVIRESTEELILAGEIPDFFYLNRAC